MGYLNPAAGLAREGRSSQAAGVELYVDALNGSDSNGGRSFGSALKTMARAFALVQSGDVINFVGKITEQLSTPVQVFDVTIRGGGNRPRHADAAPAPLGGASASTWAMPTSGPVQTTPLLIIQQQGWRLENVVLAGPTTAACVQLLRNAGAGNAERDASHAEIIGCRFASGRDGIEQSGGCYNVGIYDNSFHDLTGYAIKHTAGAGVAACYRWQIKRNRFQACANWFNAFAFNHFEIHDNVIGSITTGLLDTSGGAGHNTILRNAFDIAAADFDPVGGVTGHATDVWSNYLKDAIETGLPAN